MPLQFRAIVRDLNSPRGWAALAIIAVLLVSVFAGRLTIAMLWVYGVVGVASAMAYLFDKRAAIRGERRERESTLHLLDFFFGIAGGLLAQQLAHHKTQKPGFAAITWLIATLHLGFLLSALTRFAPAGRLGAFLLLLHGVR